MSTLGIRARAALTPERIALVAEGRATSFRELAAEAAAYSTQDSLAIVCEPNSRALFVKLVALLDAERPFALLHPKLTARERDQQVAHLHAHPALPADLAAVLFTSGSSGEPKAACLARAAFVASAHATAAHLGEDALSRWLLALPLCHVGGLSVLTRALVLGTTVVLEERFDPHVALAHELTGASLVPTLLRRLLRETSGSLARLGTVVIGGAAASAALLDEARARNMRALCTYGMTETCAQVALEPLADAALPGAARSSGTALGAASLEIVDACGTPLPAGSVGSIRISGPSLFSGYLGHEAPALPFDTGDLGWLSHDGRLHVESRRTDLILSGGENVYPLEVERALLATELLDDALVFGVAHDEWGQEVRALLVGDPERLHALASAVQLAAHKRPKHVAFVAQLPTLPSGKVDRRARPDVAFTPWPKP